MDTILIMPHRGGIKVGVGPTGPIVSGDNEGITVGMPEIGCMTKDETAGRCVAGIRVVIPEETTADFVDCGA